MRRQNFDGFHRGTVTVREALTQSLNVPAVIVLDAVGPARLVARLKRAGANPVLPDDTAAGPRDRPRRRRRHAPRPRRALRRDRPRRHAGRAAATASTTPPAAARGRRAGARSPVAAWYVADILAGMPPPLNGSPGRIAYKTGTSYGYRDAWAIGFDGHDVIGVWVGRPDGTPVPGLSGIGSAAPILFEAFDRHRAEARAAAGPRRPARSSRSTADAAGAAQALPPPERDDRRARRGGPRSPSRSTASRSISASRPATRRR